jgi:hypothetical protein
MPQAGKTGENRGTVEAAKTLLNAGKTARELRQENGGKMAFSDF